MLKARGIRDSSVLTKARLTYFQDKSLTLDLQYKADGSWTNCFALTTPEYNIAIPSVSYLGFSSETGELSDNHDIISIKTSNLYIPTNRGNNAGPVGQGHIVPGRKPTDSKDGSWGWFFFEVFLFSAVIAASYVGWTMYRSSQRRSRFWFLASYFFLFMKKGGEKMKNSNV
jgi:lectin, mannose-binding 2